MNINERIYNFTHYVLFSLVCYFWNKILHALTKTNLKQLGTNDHFGEKTLKSPGYDEMFI
jgi:hypothetical protein